MTIVKKYVFSLYVMEVILKGLKCQICSILCGGNLFMGLSLFWHKAAMDDTGELPKDRINGAKSFQGLRVLKNGQM